MKIFPGLKRVEHALEFAKLIGSFGEPTFVEISNVAQFVSQRGQKRLGTDVFPNMLCPWQTAFFEHKYFGVEGVDDKELRNVIDSLGYWVRVADRNADAEEFDSALGFAEHFIDGKLPFPEISIRFVQIVVMYELHRRRDGRRPLAEGLAVMFFDHEGQLMGAGETGFGVVLSVPRLSHDPQAMQNYGIDMLHDAAPMFMAISLAHCKNVTTRDNVPTARIPKRGQKQKPPKFTYKTLVIDGMTRVLDTEGGAKQNGLKKALHICRGHFATYTADRPLFGKVVGTVWKPMHTRGTKERGEVVKDYKVVANGQ